MEASSFGHRRMEAMKELVRGQDLAKQLQNVMYGGGSPSPSAEEAADEIIASFANALSMLGHSEPDDRSHVSDGPDDRTTTGSQDSSEESSKRKDGRGRYKRRRDSDTCSRISTALTDDGHAWRKYGQKSILNTDFPRSYYRCTHKFEQKCQATKQVQMISKDPPMYQTTYCGRHTCKNLLNSPQVVIDPEDAENLVSFGSNASTPRNNPFFSSLSFGSIKEEPGQESVVPGVNHAPPRPQSPSPSDCDFLPEYWVGEVDQLEDFMHYGSY